MPRPAPATTPPPAMEVGDAVRPLDVPQKRKAVDDAESSDTPTAKSIKRGRGGANTTSSVTDASQSAALASKIASFSGKRVSDIPQELWEMLKVKIVLGKGHGHVADVLSTSNGWLQVEAESGEERKSYAKRSHELEVQGMKGFSPIPLDSSSGDSSPHTDASSSGSRDSSPDGGGAAASSNSTAAKPKRGASRRGTTTRERSTNSGRSTPSSARPRKSKEVAKEKGLSASGGGLMANHRHCTSPGGSNAAQKKVRPRCLVFKFPFVAIDHCWLSFVAQAEDEARQARTRFYIDKQRHTYLPNRPNFSKWIEQVAFDSAAGALAEKYVCVLRPSSVVRPCHRHGVFVCVTDEWDPET